MKAQRSLLTSAIILALFGCGNDSVTSDAIATPSSTISGVAAAGSPLMGYVVVKGSEGKETSHATIAADGSFSVDVSDIEPPYRLRAVGYVGGRQYQLHSYSEAVEQDGIINITPFTDLIIANAAQQLAHEFYEKNSAVLDEQVLLEQESALQAKLTPILQSLGISETVDLLSSEFKANHNGLDFLLDIIEISVDTETAVASIRNKLNPGVTLLDSITDHDDNDVTLESVDGVDLEEIQDDTVLIAKMLEAINKVLRSGNISEATLAPFFAESFVDLDDNKAIVIAEMVDDPTLANLQFVSPSYLEWADDGQRVKLGLVLIDDDQPGWTEPLDWYVAKSDVGWQFEGNRFIVDMHFNFHCSWQANFNEPGCGVNIGVKDNDPTNTPAPYQGMLIKSAVFSNQRDGEPVANAFVFLNDADGLGQLQVVNHLGEYQGDWAGGFPSDDALQPYRFTANDFKAGDEYVVWLYTTELDLTDPTSPTPTSEAVAQLEGDVWTHPITTVSVNELPQLTPQAKTAFDAYQGGELTLAWSEVGLPEGAEVDEIWLSIWPEGEDEYGPGYVSVQESVAPEESRITLSINRSVVTDEGTYSKQVRVYALDASGQRVFSTFYIGTFDTSSFH
ncbi:hypothetical protein [Thaumasiovibrio sp. DFM-14]|uniref:hypothetical protein n=1 Tax=Thaumasiovibrio sp. DFM-14 TaxID=3384792 RepID=UPI0039A1FDEE